MNTNPAVTLSVQSLYKSYQLYDKPEDRFKDLLLNGFGKKYGRDFTALNNINFEIYQGETFGIIGLNGSGKSTLLQLIAGIIKPTSGQIQVEGKIAALLELGSGFNPELSGRENVYINGAILGMTREYMAQRYDEIVDFAGIGDYIEQPVKFYSSGMFVRLAFAVATAVEADILLIDEALAVGDVFFRQKCYARLEQLRQKGTAIILVSHSMGEVQEFCLRTLLLHKGQQVFLGDTVNAVSQFYQINQETNMPATTVYQKQTSQLHQEKSQASAADFFWPEAQYFLPLPASAEVVGGVEAQFCALALCDSEGQGKQIFTQGETIFIYYEYAITGDIEIPVGGVVIRNEKNIIVHGKNTMQYFSAIEPVHEQDKKIRFCQSFQLDLAEGEYTFEVGLSTIQNKYFKNRHLIKHEELSGYAKELVRVINGAMISVRRNTTQGPAQLAFHGLCELAGSCQIQYVR